MLGSLVNGFILNIQFFSTIPIRKKEVPITPKNLRRAVQLFPVLGLLQGGMLAALCYLLTEYSFFSSLAVTFLLWLFIIIITGAIHLDGWIDSSDAFFSYRGKERRIEILADPRVGAFGLISGIILLATRFLFIYEIIIMKNDFTNVLILLIPFFGKTFMGMILSLLPPMKKSGLGYLFHEASKGSIFHFYTVYILLIFVILFLFQAYLLLVMSLCMLVVILICYFFAKGKLITWFGGINGDVVGGATEGIETILWLIIWLFHYYAMGSL